MASVIPPYRRLATREVRIGPLLIGSGHPIRIQTMTTTDTMDTAATVAQTIRCIEAGAELVRITAPSKKEAENLAEIKRLVRATGYDTPLVADIHFTPNAAEIAARIVEKVRINPGNYVDKKKFDQIDYTDAEYAAEIDRIRERFTPLVRICKAYGTAMRIGTNHGSLSDRIMSRYGDTALGMVESAMEFLRIAREEEYHQIILSMKSSNPIVMVDAYRTLGRHMQEEFGECYPLHLGVTEAGDGEDGRIKSAIGIGTLLHEGIGDTIRVSLTEEPEFELPVCKDLIESLNPALYGGGGGGLTPALSKGEGDRSRGPALSKGEGDRSRGPALSKGEGDRSRGPALSKGEGDGSQARATPPPLEGEGAGGRSYLTADRQYAARLVTFAKQNRKQPTWAEEKLWECLRGRKLDGYKFRRQHPIDRYIADFVNLEKGLVIELDGSIHQLPEVADSDAERTGRLEEEHGFRVIRFTNDEVEQDFFGVVKRIRAALEAQASFARPGEANFLPPARSKGEGVMQPPLAPSPLSLGEGPGVRTPPTVLADFMHQKEVQPQDLRAIGYTYDAALDKWHISDGAADFIYLGEKTLDFELPGTLRPVLEGKAWQTLPNRDGYVPHFPLADFDATHADAALNIVSADVTEAFFADGNSMQLLVAAGGNPAVTLCLYSSSPRPAAAIKAACAILAAQGLQPQLIIGDMSFSATVDQQLIDFSICSGTLFLEGYGDGIWLMNDPSKLRNAKVSGRTYLEVTNNHQFLNNTAFSILQATRRRISKTEYISCPSCGRTLFDLQETTAKIRAATHHLKGVKIAIMGCIVNGPGEMADADFGYVGSGPGKITLYKSKDVMKRNVPSEVAVEELINLLKESGAWCEPAVGTT